MPGIFGRGSQETVCGGAEEVNPAGRQLKTDWAKPLKMFRGLDGLIFRSG